MLKSFFTITLRHFNRQLSYSIINVVGLAIGIACSLVILIYALRELGYEKHFEGHETVYRIATKFMTMGEFANGPEVLLEEMPKEYGWIENTCRVQYDNTTVNYNDFSTKFSGLFVEPSFFEIFPYPFEEGSPSNQPYTIVLSRETATTLFDKEKAVGKVIQLDMDDESDKSYTVVGVVNLANLQSHLNASFWAVKASSNQEIETNWFSIAKHNYIKVKEGTSHSTVQEALNKIIETKVFPNLGSTLSFDEWFVRDDAFRLMAQPIDDIYLKGTLRFDLTPGGNETTVFVLLAIAVLILIIASVNFINLSTARAIKRSREVGIKKVMGSARSTLIFQFLGESIFISFIAMVFSLGLAELLLIVVEKITGLEILGSVFSNYANIVLAVLTTLVLGIISGIYPAFVLSAFSPAAILKSVVSSGGGRSAFRNALVIFQFALSTTLIVSSVIIFRQLQYMKTRDMGFKQDNILIVNNANKLADHVNGFKEEIKGRAGVLSVSLVNRLPGSSSSFSISTLESPYLEEPLKVNRFMGDYDYIPTLDFQIVEGRTFSKDVGSDSTAIVLNESAVKALQLENPIGERLNNKYTVIGVVRDFNFETLRKKIDPAIITLGGGGYQMAIKLESQSAAGIISFIEGEWKRLSPDEPLAYHFLDENFDKLMRNEKIIGKVVAIFTVLAIGVSCLGLFGLSAYMASQRRKEIGIRKVLGASISDVLMLFNKEYTVLVLIAFIVAVPASIYLMNKWLSEFAYRTSISFWVILVTGVITLMIAWLTVSYHTFKASTVNPAETLKYE